jgi:hypothetical protein
LSVEEQPEAASPAGVAVPCLLPEAAAGPHRMPEALPGVLAVHLEPVRHQALPVAAPLGQTAAVSPPEFLPAGWLQPVWEQTAAALSVEECRLVVSAAAAARAEAVAASRPGVLAGPGGEARVRTQAVSQAEVLRPRAAPAAGAGALPLPGALVPPASAAGPDLSDWDSTSRPRQRHEPPAGMNDPQEQTVSGCFVGTTCR